MGCSFRFIRSFWLLSRGKAVGHGARLLEFRHSEGCCPKGAGDVGSHIQGGGYIEANPVAVAVSFLKNSASHIFHPHSGAQGLPELQASSQQHPDTAGRDPQSCELPHSGALCTLSPYTAVKGSLRNRM